MLDQVFQSRGSSLDSSQLSAVDDNWNVAERQRKLCRDALLLPYKRSQNIYWQGDDAASIYFIESGIVRVFRSTTYEKRQIISFRTAGDICGLPENGLYANSAETVSACSLYRISWKSFSRLISADTELQLMLLKKLASEFREAQSLITILGQENILHRVVNFLVSMISSSEFFDPRESLLHLPMNRFDVADYLGTSSETAGRMFTKLENLGVIRRLTPRRIEILDLETLRVMQKGPRRAANKVQRTSIRTKSDAPSSARHV